MQKYKTHIRGEITLHVAQTVDTEQLNTVYPSVMVCFGYVIVNVSRKGY